MGGSIVEAVLSEVQPQHLVPGVAGEVVGIVQAGVVGIRVGLRQGFAPGVVDGVGDDLAVSIHREQGAAQQACPVPHLPDVVGGEAALEVFPALAEIRGLQRLRWSLCLNQFLSRPLRRKFLFRYV